MSNPTADKRLANYRTHKTRVSDSSLYDEVCTVCGARDYVPGVDELSEQSCADRLEARSSWEAQQHKALCEDYFP